jgi:MOSC domain-containing protein YiiM
MLNGEPTVVAVACAAEHDFSKRTVPAICLLEGIGVEGDAHAGAHVKHRSRLAKNAAAPNLRQVHLIQSELFDELRGFGFDVVPAQIGENITTRGIDLPALPLGTVLRIGPDARVQLTGLRTPCGQIDDFQPGLLKAVIARDAEGRPVLKSGVMGVVVAGGAVRPGDTITVELPTEPFQSLGPV